MCALDQCNLWGTLGFNCIGKWIAHLNNGSFECLLNQDEEMLNFLLTLSIHLYYSNYTFTTDLKDCRVKSMYPMEILTLAKTVRDTLQGMIETSN
jgi:hypothetical protein